MRQDSHGALSQNARWFVILTALAAVVGIIVGLNQLGIIHLGEPSAATAQNGTPSAHGTSTAGQAAQATNTPANLTYLMSLNPENGPAPGTGLATIDGVQYQSSIWFDPNTDNACVSDSVSVTYSLAGKYRHFTAAIGMDTASTDNQDRFQVYRDGSRIFDQSVSKNQRAVPVDLDVSGAHTLTLTVVVGNCIYDVPIFANAALSS